ncbi:coenzyme F420-0:L-glutamate ligase [Ancylobacter sp. 6x-1]|uniref:Coenzyme F420-0:L-glutamate ligase n=1 Tax=Ancylobacter crimeensis TaxID=2579147 RepID=A0ABT0DBH8_9HYPH|nr:coenzyme F420-0:L-glutamate ligase [Ancylobacter crimeensis]MCK0197322.1 coenzyme F420-0:L-glutamate ligase [Ancylobacter crimeensis]
MQPSASLELLALPDVPLVGPGQDLAALVLDGLARAGRSLAPDDVLVLAQKIVSKAEGRLVDLETVVPSAPALELAATVRKDPRFVELVLSESTRVVRARAGVLIVEHRLGFVMANAGIDRSNVAAGEREHALLLPLDPDASAARLRDDLSARTGIAPGIVINDSFGRAWRQGTMGIALGVAGLPALVDQRGESDLFGRTLEVTVIGFADEIASAASLLMGQAGEGRPIVLVRGLASRYPHGCAGDLVRPAGEDLFR